MVVEHASGAVAIHKSDYWKFIQVLLCQKNIEIG